MSREKGDLTTSSFQSDRASKGSKNMENPNVFEVQTPKDGRWMIEQRCRNEEEAVAEARDLFDSRHF